MTRFPVIVLWLSALLFLAFGVGCLIQPELLTQFGLPVQPVWRTELRAFYGGLEIGLATFLILCARRPAWVLPGLLAAALVLGCVGTARLLGMALDGPVRNMLVAMVAELSGCALAVAAVVHEGRRAGRHR